MTALLDPTTDPNRRPTPGAATRFATVRANLMPDEVLSARQTEVVRRRVLLALAALVAVIIAGFGASWLQTNSAHNALDDANRRHTALVAQQRQYQPLATAQAQAQAARQQLASLMTGDANWSTVLATLRSKAPSGVSLTSVSATVTPVAGAGAAALASTATDPLNPTGATQVGTLTVLGTAGSKDSVAAYSDALSKLTGVTSVLVTNVAQSDTGLTFTVTAQLTTDLLGGRFTTKTAKVGSTIGGN